MYKMYRIRWSDNCSLNFSIDTFLFPTKSSSSQRKSNRNCKEKKRIIDLAQKDPLVFTIRLELKNPNQKIGSFKASLPMKIVHQKRNSIENNEEKKQKRGREGWWIEAAREIYRRKKESVWLLGFIYGLWPINENWNFKGPLSGDGLLFGLGPVTLQMQLIKCNVERHFFF